MRIFYHLVDLTLVNSWIMYRKNQIERKDKYSYLTLAEVRMEIAECFCKIGFDRPSKRGRPSNTIEQQISEKNEEGQHLMCHLRMSPPME